MTTQELIEQLEMLPSDVPVVFQHRGATVDVTQVVVALSTGDLEIKAVVLF